MKRNYFTKLQLPPEPLTRGLPAPYSFLSVLNWICWTPPEQNSWVRHWCLLVYLTFLRAHYRVKVRSKGDKTFCLEPLLSFSFSFFLSFLFWPLLCIRFRCKEVLLHLFTLNDTQKHKHAHTHKIDKTSLGEGSASRQRGSVRTCNPRKRAVADPHLRLRCQWDRPFRTIM